MGYFSRNWLSAVAWERYAFGAAFLLQILALANANLSLAAAFSLVAVVIFASTFFRAVIFLVIAALPGPVYVSSVLFSSMVTEAFRASPGPGNAVSHLTGFFAVFAGYFAIAVAQVWEYLLLAFLFRFLFWLYINNSKTSASAS